MRVAWFFLIGCLFFPCPGLGFERISKPRFAVGDVDRDGEMEVIVGGRVGRFLGVDAPWASRRARVGVYRRQGQILKAVAESENMHVVADVSVGDVDGNGVGEVIVVGAGRLRLLAMVGDRLVVRALVQLDGLWTDRVVVGDVVGDGRVDVGVTVYEVAPESEVGQTWIVFYTWEDGAFKRRYQMAVPMHVGDLCLEDLDGRRGPELILETGAEEEGGEGRVYRWIGGQYQVFGQGPMSDDGLRVFSVSGLPGPASGIVAGTPDGRIRFFDFDGGGFRFRQEVKMAPGLSNAVLIPGPGRALGVVAGPSFEVRPFSF